MTESVQRSPRKPKGAGSERREEILAAALRLFGQYGLHGVSTRQIAQAVGISQPTLYAYFPAKDEIAAELHDRAFRDLERRYEGLPLGARDVDAIAAVLQIYVDFGLSNPDAYRVAFMLEGMLGRQAPSCEPDISKPAKRAFDIMRQLVGDLHAAGLSRTDDPERLAQSLWAGLHGLVSLLIARPGFPWADRQTLIASHVRLLAEAALRAR
ncbi:TetR/AcrR family transcriptional regulator [Phenylobacterium sp. J426]|uniref:TetR/AcrR family transcriptional regulator n=1 Tax=Phenylobacterium sp. J426 TaxID=2898439 RepID=UPI0021513C41|nr:TetR/AcrR family transcriptional regulator [Phenylobacterium sp. J426]MCR5876740.1 TetR/AcrR family transcriptional regulator [Phenylobacterium sp. J426]